MDMFKNTIKITPAKQLLDQRTIAANHSQRASISAGNICDQLRVEEWLRLEPSHDVAYGKTVHSDSD